MKAIVEIKQDPTKTIQAHQARFQWHLVKQPITDHEFYALPSHYGVIYIDPRTNHASFSNRDFFDRKYIIIKELDTLTITFNNEY